MATCFHHVSYYFEKDLHRKDTHSRTTSDTPLTNSIDITPKPHVHKMESNKATQAKQSKQPEELVVHQIK